MIRNARITENEGASKNIFILKMQHTILPFVKQSAKKSDEITRQKPKQLSVEDARAILGVSKYDPRDYKGVDAINTLVARFEHFPMGDEPQPSKDSVSEDLKNGKVDELERARKYLHAWSAPDSRCFTASKSELKHCIDLLSDAREHTFRHSYIEKYPKDKDVDEELHEMRRRFRGVDRVTEFKPVENTSVEDLQKKIEAIKTPAQREL